MTMRPITLATALFVLLFWNLGCQSLVQDPFGGGGTETGNPGMLACAHAIFEELSNTSNQSPQTYLPENEADLDPGRIVKPRFRRFAFARACVADTDTVFKTISLDANTNVAKYVYSVDTIVSVSSIIIRDTVSIDSVTSDTLDSSNASPKDFTVIVKRRINADIVIDDSVVYRRDTILTQRKDSTFIKFSDSANAKTKIINDTVPGNKSIINNPPSMNTDSVVIDSIFPDRLVIRIPSKAAPNNYFGSGIAVPNTGFKMYDNSGYIRFMRESKPSGAVREAYDDGDGDGYLFTAPGMISMRSRFSGTYNTNESMNDISVVFDAGDDKLFSTTGDNRILSLALNRRTYTGDERLETVTYSSGSNTSAGDLVFLTRKRHSLRNPANGDSVTYYCLKGKDPLDHRQNKIAKLTQSLFFHDSIVQSLETEITFDTSTGSQQELGAAKASARLSYGKARIGLFEGRLDMKDGALYGSYTENGIVYHCYYDRDSDILFWGQNAEKIGPSPRAD